jgi:glutamyl-tRNA synthetase
MQGQKLSKRKLDIDISAFEKIGVLPEALDNFVALLGWSHSQPKDFMTLQQLVQNVCSPDILCLLPTNVSGSSLPNLRKATQKCNLISFGFSKSIMQ